MKRKSTEGIIGSNDQTQRVAYRQDPLGRINPIYREVGILKRVVWIGVWLAVCVALFALETIYVKGYTDAVDTEQGQEAQ